ncbi:MAG: histone deacetylase family protein [Kiloniellales bacterium]
MTTQLWTHPACLQHAPGEGHPERPERLAAVLAALDGEEFGSLERREAPQASREQLSRAHPPGFVDQILAAVPRAGLVGIDPDTLMSPGTGAAALHAAGALCAAIDAVVGGEARNAFCAVRPPGHHAERSTAMGFCFFNNVAVGAYHARAVHGLKKVAVIDFDVHHGNGTQDIFWSDRDLFYVSTHQMPLYPGSGAADERGSAGNVLNLPLAPFATGEQFRNAISTKAIPALERFRPDLILISAGFDGHDLDPLAQLRLVESDYAWVTAELADLAGACCGGRLVSALEGGYNLDALASSAAAHVQALMAA